MVTERKQEIFDKTKEIIRTHGYGSAISDDLAKFELLNVGTKVGEFVENNPSMELIARISNIVLSLCQLGYSYSLNELKDFFLKLDADELQYVYNQIRDGKFNKVKSNIQ